MVELEKINTTALAYLGDSIYEVYVRERLVKSGEMHADMLHKKAVKYVKASAQAKVLKILLNEVLTEEEITISKRARNHKMRTMAKHADPIDYKNATAFEALIGYTYLKNDIKRLEFLIDKAFNIVEDKDE